MKRIKTIALLAVIFTIVVWLAVSCDESYTPKPRGFLRIDLPENTYLTFDSARHYRFEHATTASIRRADEAGAQQDWFTIQYPSLKAEIYLSYKAVDNNLAVYLEDARTMALKHLPKASGIADSLIIQPGEKVFGSFYFIQGKGVASPVQFYLTDSTRHFVRGALYFGFRPNNDSIAPVIQFLKKDLRHMVGTFSWKD